jgi:tetratricopeptide (TPR) repeat protein
VIFRRLVACFAASTCSLFAREIDWTRLDAGKFTIISAVSEKETLSWAVEFEQFHQGIQKVLRINEAALQPVTVVLFRSQSEMRPYKPLEKGRPAEVAGMFMRTPLGNFIEAAADSEDQQTRQLIFHEGVHWLTNVSDTQPPLWLDEGLAEVFSTFSVDGDLYNYGNVLPWHVLLLDRGPTMPLKQLLAVQHGSLLYNEGERTSIFYAESWAFVHYLLFSGKLEERTRYNQLVRALRADSDPDTVFKQVFGADCAAMDQRLRDYLRSGSYTINRIRFDRSGVEHSFKIRRASRAEVDLAESSLLSAEDRPAEALPRLERITHEMPDNPLPWEAEGFAAYQVQDYDETETCFRRAASLGSRNYFVYSFLGDLALGALPGRITAAVASDLRLAVNYYEHELELNPGDQHAYDNLAGNSYTLDPISALDAAILNEGHRRFPHDGMIQVGLAVVDLRQGDAVKAVSALGSMAADRSPSNKDASAYAHSILDSRMQSEAFDRINDLWKKQDFDAVIVCVDELLKSQMPADYRDNLNNTRARAVVAAKIKHAMDFASSGELQEAKSLLLDADASATDRQMKAQIQALLDRIEKAMSGARQ